MSTCAVMLVKDEADIIERTVRHLVANVDEVIVADNMSSDGTTAILRSLVGEVPLTVIRDTEVGHYQSQKTTDLAMQALGRGHRWVVPCDADEIWIAPEGRTISDWLDGIGREIQFVKGTIYNHVATAKDDKDDENPLTRIRFRQRTHLDMRWGKVACRLRPDLVIRDGNHSAATSGVGTTGYGLEIRHFPYRSPEHFIRKAKNGLRAFQATNLDESVGAHWRVYGKAVEEGGDAAGAAWFYDAFYSDDPEADDSLVYDPAPFRGGGS